MLKKGEHNTKMQACNDEPTASTSGTTASAVRSNCLITYDWDAYIIKENNKMAAPPSYFKQHLQYPANPFKEGMKLEVDTYRDLIYSCCLATVKAVVGPRIRLRFEGEEDDKNDFWRLMDADDIHPVGYSKQTGRLLKPPLGDPSSASSFHGLVPYLQQSMKLAPPGIFLKQPQTPVRNYFFPGQRLEAVVKAKPEFIWPATIGAVEDEKLFLRFDDGQGRFDYWCSYDSRDIFPIGWCERNKHPLQSPEQKVYVYVNEWCKCGPYLDPLKVASLPMVFTAKSASQALQQCVQALVDAALDQKKVFDLLPLGEGRVKITAIHNNMDLFICLPAVERINQFWTFLKMFLKDLKCCNNFCTEERLMKCEICEKATGQNSVNQKKGTSVKTKVPPPIPSGNPSHWSTEDVIQYIASKYPELGAHADIFRREEIDGQACLMLTLNHLKDHMNLPLGSVVKILNIIGFLKKMKTESECRHFYRKGHVKH